MKKEDDWRKPFIDFIIDHLVPDDKAERERITLRSANYVVIGSDLYRKAASTGILMKCILRSEGLQLLAEIHSGECGCHVASTNLVGKAYRSGFYWPTAVTDAKGLVKRCKGCQFFAKQQHLATYTSTNAIIYDHYLVTISCLVIEVLFAVTKKYLVIEDYSFYDDIQI
jgi:hypothetical protein